MEVVKILLVIAIILPGCVSAPKHLAKARKKDELYVVNEIRKDYPCDVTSSDTTYRIDTLYDILQPEYPDPITDSFETSVAAPVYIKGKPKKYFITRTITNNVKDRAEIFALNATVSELETNAVKISTDRDNFKEGRNDWRKRFFLLLAAFGIAIFLRIKKFL